jgi:hypothetical protein
MGQMEAAGSFGWVRARCTHHGPFGIKVFVGAGGSGPCGRGAVRRGRMGAGYCWPHSQVSRLPQRGV